MRCIAALLAPLLMLLPARGDAAQPRPNILLCISDDQSWCHTGRAGDPVVRTPAFDRVAEEGAYFSLALCAAPSCSPSRAALVTGRQIWQLDVAAAIFGPLHPSYATYPELLADAGYHVGHTGKGWGPGNFKSWGRQYNPAGGEAWQQHGKDYAANFRDFLDAAPEGAPFCFWLGSTDPHQPFTRGGGATAGLDAAKVHVPPQHPDTPEVRRDITDYMAEIERWDRDLAKALALLDERGLSDNTLLIVTSDHGWDFSRGKATLYDYGARVPLAMRWPQGFAAGQQIDAPVGLIDLAATILEAANLPLPRGISGRSLLPLLTGRSIPAAAPFDGVVYGIERHGPYRAGGLGYPSRALRTADYLYIRNFAPERWPNGDPPFYGDPSSDRSEAKQWILAHREMPEGRRLFELAYGKRSAEELYDLKADPYQLTNVAGDAAYEAKLGELRQRLTAYLDETDDPRMTGRGEELDRIPLFQGKINQAMSYFWPQDNDARLDEVRARWELPPQ